MTSGGAERVVVIESNVRLKVFEPKFLFVLLEVWWHIQTLFAEEAFGVDERLVILVSHLLN